MRATGAAPFDDLGIAIAGLTPLAVHARYLGLWSPTLTTPVLATLVILALAIWRRWPNGRPIAAVSTTVLGVLYTGGMLSFGYAIRYHPYTIGAGPTGLGSGWLRIPAGGLLLVLPLLVTWGSDIGAYFVGRTLGKRKLIPAVSPGKTVAGAVGALVTSVGITWLYTRGVLKPVAHLDMRTAGILAFGLLVSAAAQVGDLFESLIKRESGVKDSSHLIPGHGGVLDRLDSLIFVLPVSWALLGWLLIWAP